MYPRIHVESCDGHDFQLGPCAKRLLRTTRESPSGTWGTTAIIHHPKSVATYLLIPWVNHSPNRREATQLNAQNSYGLT